MSRLLPFIFLAVLARNAFAGSEKTLEFSGYEWTVFNAPGLSGPGPNLWDGNNAWVDERGWLHFKITRHGDKWYCAEVFSSRTMGFGHYQWEITGNLDQFAPQIVLGLFDYPPPGGGPDGTNEIDIEFARWGKATIPPGNFSVWPVVLGLERKTYPFDFKLVRGVSTTSSFDWSPKGVRFRMIGPDANVLSQWDYTPAKPEKYIPQQSLPLHINFWLCDGKPPGNNQEAEVIIKKFTFTPRLSD
jgi:hypothetical protein